VNLVLLFARLDIYASFFLPFCILLPQFVIVLLFQRNFLQQPKEADQETIHVGVRFFILTNHALGI
jgi:hypothetical protein